MQKPMTSCWGFLQTVLFRYSGVRFREGEITREKRFGANHHNHLVMAARTLQCGKSMQCYKSSQDVGVLGDLGLHYDPGDCQIGLPHVGRLSLASRLQLSRVAPSQDQEKPIETRSLFACRGAYTRLECGSVHAITACHQTHIAP
jgi:hypothetical protein